VAPVLERPRQPVGRQRSRGAALRVSVALGAGGSRVLVCRQADRTLDPSAPRLNSFLYISVWFFQRFFYFNFLYIQFTLTFRELL
jgi:hypothetical protein